MIKPFVLNDSLLHLDGPGPIGRLTNTNAFWGDRQRSELSTGHIVSVISYDTTWEYQERHPDGEELVVVLQGDINLLLDNGDGEQAVNVDHAHGCVIPAGVWHRVSTHQPSTILFVTPTPARTEHRDTQPG